MLNDKENLKKLHADTWRYSIILEKISDRFEEYGMAKSTIKLTLLYISEYYKALPPPVFMGPRWIDIDLTVRNEVTNDLSHLLEKTVNHKYKPYQCYQLDKIPIDRTTWTLEDQKKYKIIRANDLHIYDTILTDALYRMRYQRIDISSVEPDTGLFTKEQWKKYYLDGFYILDDLELVTENTAEGYRLIKAKIMLSEALVWNIDLLWFLVYAEGYRALFLGTRNLFD
ncbi:MAG: hypothetical protein ACQPRH_04800 [Solitalea-like symbiont of Tyrophagus putrescentiae]